MSLIEGVRLTPVNGQLEIELKGDLAGILAIFGPEAAVAASLASPIRLVLNAI